MNFENNSSRLELMIEKNNQDLQERCDKMQKQLEALQCETIRTRPNSRCNIFTANLILSIMEFAIWITLFIFGLGRNIISKDYWQFYEKNYNLSIVAFFLSFLEFWYLKFMELLGPAWVTTWPWSVFIFSDSPNIVLF